VALEVDLGGKPFLVEITVAKAYTTSLSSLKESTGKHWLTLFIDVLQRMQLDPQLPRSQ